MKSSRFDGTSLEWLARNSDSEPQEIQKASPQTRAWFACIRGRDMFIKWYPLKLQDSWGHIETAIAGGIQHPHIVPLQERVHCTDGALLVYERVPGKSLGPPQARMRFQRLPASERMAAVAAVSEALTAICEAGFMIVDWYEGNMIYDFDARHIWLFDWELCRPGASFILEMENNYGTSRLMAPEEFVKGSRLDQTTLVYNLGRYVLLTLPEFAKSLASLVVKATHPVQTQRFATAREFATALHRALQNC